MPGWILSLVGTILTTEVRVEVGWRLGEGVKVSGPPQETSSKFGKKNSIIVVN